MFEELLVKTNKKEEILDITDKVKEIVKKSKVKEGICLVYAKHATASIVINENYDPNVCEDILSALNKCIPEHAPYKHNCIDNNAASHIKATLIGPGKTIPVKDSNLELGTWQGVALAELDGPRERHVLVEIIGS
jgi:secondary thiamine-phosphate synthase enzyme